MFFHEIATTNITRACFFFPLDKITHDFVICDFLGKTTNSCYITVDNILTFSYGGFDPFVPSNRLWATTNNTSDLTLIFSPLTFLTFIRYFQIPFPLSYPQIKNIIELAQMVACLPLVQQVRGSIPGGVVNFHLKIFNLRARRGIDIHFLIARLYITGLG